MAKKKDKWLTTKQAADRANTSTACLAAIRNRDQMYEAAGRPQVGPLYKKNSVGRVLYSQAAVDLYIKRRGVRGARTGGVAA